MANYFSRPLVSSEWLVDHLEDPDLRVFDTTTYLERTPSGLKSRSGREDYESAHIPGAGFLDIAADLSDTSSALAYTRPPVAQMERVLSRSGVSNQHHAVLYCRGRMMWATRAWWLLRWVGLESVAILDGGMSKWEAEGCATCDKPCAYSAARFEAIPRDDLWATKEDVLEAIENGAFCTINALRHELHTGESGLGYARNGHIRGSLNVPYNQLLRPESEMFAEDDELRRHFDSTGAFNKRRVITYCGGGIAATMNAFALLLLGHPSVAVYDGGLDEWSRDEGLPMEMGQ
jgi:thiosulfate/3-mercaptopyruvate sulfurtransferase